MKVLSEVANDALELARGERRTLARILLQLSEEDQDFSPEAEAAWENEIVRSMETVKAGRARHSTCATLWTPDGCPSTQRGPSQYLA